MKIRLGEVRRFIRKVLKEAEDARTVSADLSKGEQELSDKFPKWGNPAAEKLSQRSPNQVKEKQIAAILQKKGITADPDAKKKTVQGLKSWLDNMDPADAFAADPDELAQKFATEVLGVRGD